MNPPCIYHPALPAVGPCVECGAPVCKHCAQIISEHVCCPKCVPIVRSKLGIAAPATPPQQWTAPGPSQPAQPAASAEEVLTLDSTEKRRLMVAAGVSLAIGIVFSVVIMQIVNAAAGDMGYVGPVTGLASIYVIYGVGVGFSFCKIADVGGEEIIAFVAAGIMVLSMIFGHIYYVCLYAVGHHDNFFSSLGPALAGMPVFHWILALVSLVVCWVTVKAQV